MSDEHTEHIENCPYCSGTIQPPRIQCSAYIRRVVRNGSHAWHVCCYCGASGPCMDCTSGKNRQKAIDAWNHIAKQAGRIKELEETITRQSGYIRELETVYTVCNLETTNANERIAELEARIAELEADYDDSGLLYERDRRIAELEVQLAEEKGGE